MPEDEINEMARALSRLVDNDAKLLAARLMIYFCDDNKPIPSSSNADHLIFYLDGGFQSGDAYDKNIGPSVLKTLGSFSETEGKIVLEWLIQIGRPRFSRLCGKDVESAISFWTERNKQKK